MLTNRVIVVLCPRCVHCGQASTVEMPEKAFWAWQQEGKYIQDAWPEASAAVREQLISGTHPKCWDEMWAEDKDDD